MGSPSWIFLTRIFSGFELEYDKPPPGGAFTLELGLELELVNERGIRTFLGPELELE